MSTPAARPRFRSMRETVSNLLVAAAGVILLSVVGISILVSPPSGPANATGAVTTCGVAILMILCLMLRMRVAFTVELENDALVYRTLLRTRRFRRSDIEAIGKRDRHHRLPIVSVPYLTMKDGRTVWLIFMDQGKLIASNSTMQDDLIAAVRAWLAPL